MRRFRLAFLLPCTPVFVSPASAQITASSTTGLLSPPGLGSKIGEATANGLRNIVT